TFSAWSCRTRGPSPVLVAFRCRCNAAGLPLKIEFAREKKNMITREEASDLFRSDDLVGIGMQADAIRRKLHPHNVVSYIIDRNINYTNFCTEYCSFCAFYRPVGHKE